MSQICAVLLAAGKGSRFKSERPKVLQTLLGDSMLALVCHSLAQSGQIAEIVVVLGHQANQVEQELSAIRTRAAWLDLPLPPIRTVLQPEQLGTGHAVRSALPQIQAERVLIVNGDMPLLEASLLNAFINEAQAWDLAFLSQTLADPAAFGRVLRQHGKLTGIVEYKNLSLDQAALRHQEINSGLYLSGRDLLVELLPQLKRADNSGEYYLTDLIALALAAGKTVEGLDAEQLCPGQSPWLSGVNTALELAMAESDLQQRQIAGLFAAGAILHNPEQIFCSPTCQVAVGAEISGPCRIFGQSRLEQCVVEPFCEIAGSRLEQGAQIRSFSHLCQARVGQNCQVGPYARLRPQAELRENARIGNFVEMKKAVLGVNSKANHLTYLGDAQIGQNVNIGAGTITCNYDGRNKYQTTIQDGAFIGSNTALVAPVTLGEHSLIGAGSVITKDVPAKHLAVTRAKQTMFERRDQADDET